MNLAIYEENTIRKAGRYFSRCRIPADTFNEGRFVVGVNASTYRIKRYFQDERAITFNVDPAGAPGMHWPEQTIGSGPTTIKLEYSGGII